MSKKKTDKNKKQNDYWCRYITKDKRCYLDDIIEGKIKIYNVPFKYRTDTAYSYACRCVWSTENKEKAFTEGKLIEKLLLDDIIKLSKKHMCADAHKAVYQFYFYSENGIPHVYEGCFEKEKK